MNKRLVKLVDSQVEYNKLVNGKYWHTGVTRDGLNIDFELAIIQELSELINELDYKWWLVKKDRINIDYVINEICDVVLFSIGLVCDIDDGSLLTELFKPVDYKCEDKEDILFNTVEAIRYISTYNYNSNKHDLKRYFKAVKEIITVTPKITVELLYRHCNAKIALNTLRYLKGVENGSYDRVWVDKKDIDITIDLINKSNITEVDDFYDKLNDIYDTQYI